MADEEEITINGDVTEEELIEFLQCPLYHYHSVYWRGIQDYTTVIQNRTEVETGIWQFECIGQNIYLDNNGYAVTYADQYVFDGEVYYDFPQDFNVELSDTSGTFVHLNTYEWKRDSPCGGGVRG